MYFSHNILHTALFDGLNIDVEKSFHVVLKVHCATFRVKNSRFLTHTCLNNRLMG